MRTARFDDEQSQTVPSTITEWLMMRSGDPPTVDDSHNLIVADAIKQLSDESQFILHAIFYERTTYQVLADRLGVSKPHAWRLTRRAIDELSLLISDNPTLKGRYR